MKSIRATENPGEMIRILMDLRTRLPQLSDDNVFAASIPRFLSLGGYKFVIAEAERSNDPSAFGVLTFYKAPMIDSIVLAVEAMWLKDEKLEDQLWIWADLASYAQRLEFAAVCVADRSVNTPAALTHLAQAGGFQTRSGVKYSVQSGEPVLQGTVTGLYSAFESEPLTGSAFFASCVMIAPFVAVNLTGTPAEP